MRFDRPQWLRRLTAPIRLRSELPLVVGAPLLWLALYNFRFWRDTSAAMWQPSLEGVLFLASLMLVTLVLEVLLVLFLPGRLLRTVACVLCLFAAPIAYFSDTYGVFVGKEMLRNVMATDAAEVAELISPRLILYLLLLGVVPCLVILRIEVPALGWRRRLAERGAFFAVAVGLGLLGALASSAGYASFLREHKPLRYFLNPVVPVYNAARLWMASAPPLEKAALADVGGVATRTEDGVARPLVLFLVVGETARAANFQLGGYERATNPELSQIDELVYFPRATACATATAMSLPCLFSHVGREDFDPDVAEHSTNLLDALAQAGLDVEWRDNNSGCKGVCDRVRNFKYTQSADPTLCPAAHCYDEHMLRDLPTVLRNLKQDSVIVFHQVGSHGPTYSDRYPPAFDVFEPACRSNRLDQCSREEVLNAYDNSILYTDHVLARQIALLRDASDQIDSLLIYVSDHGESLGENGLYLHGMPWALAPAYQKEVPFLIWMSPGYEQRTGSSAACLEAQADAEISHDEIFHTVMGALGVRSPVYRASWDLFSRCARPQASSPAR